MVNYRVDDSVRPGHGRRRLLALALGLISRAAVLGGAALCVHGVAQIHRPSAEVLLGALLIVGALWRRAPGGE